MRQRAERARRVVRDQPERRLQRDRAGEAGRNPHGATAVGAHRPRAHAQPDRCRAAAAGPAGRRRRVPRVAGRPERDRVGDALPRVLRGGGLTQDHRAGFAQPRHTGRVLVPRAGGVDQRAAPQRRPAAGQEDVLDRRRHPVARTEGFPGVPTGLGLLGRRERALGVDEDERVDRAVVDLDRVQRGLGGLHRGDALVPVAGNEFGRLGHRRVRHHCPPGM